MAVKKDKNSNHELMRLISMFFIVLWHVTIFVRLQGIKNEWALAIYNMILFFVCIHVNSYVLLTGYYQSKSKFKFNGIWDIIKSSWFYRVVIMLVFLFFGWISISKVQILKDLAPIGIDNYWFIKCYLILYCISPFLNILIENLDKKLFKRLILTGFIIFCIIPYLTGGEFFTNTGYSVYNFIYLYFLGAFLRIYPPQKSTYFKNKSVSEFRKKMVITVISCFILNTIIYYVGIKIKGINNLFDTISSYIDYSSLNYSNPIIIIQSIAYFSIFSSLNIKSKLINRVSPLMLGIYFIHENNYIRESLYKAIGLASNNRNNISFIFYMLLMAILIYIVCAIIELLRQVLFNFIENSSLAKKFRTKCSKSFQIFKEKYNI